MNKAKNIDRERESFDWPDPSKTYLSHEEFVGYCADLKAGNSKNLKKLVKRYGWATLADVAARSSLSETNPAESFKSP